MDQISRKGRGSDTTKSRQQESKQAQQQAQSQPHTTRLRRKPVLGSECETSATRQHYNHLKVLVDGWRNIPITLIDPVTWVLSVNCGLKVTSTSQVGDGLPYEVGFPINLILRRTIGAQRWLALVKKKDELSKKLLELAKRFAKSGRRLTDGSGKVKAIGFVGVRKPDTPANECDGRTLHQ
jgi:hypothetical protein